MPKKSAADKPAKEKAPAKKSPKPAEKTEPKEEKKVTKKAVKPAAVAETKPKAAKKAAAEKAAAEKPKAAKGAGKTKKAAVAVPSEQLEEHIRVAAYYRWEESGRPEGAHENDWLEAEKSIRK
ncbi:MAG: DUF2934 domain-containing protein [Chlorobiaceae bacterium]|nr:DUF2934 domain-containing protein [Chlorobiaceae bacterium]